MHNTELDLLRMEKRAIAAERQSALNFAEVCKLREQLVTLREQEVATMLEQAKYSEELSLELSKDDE